MKCPNCGSENISTEKRIDGDHICGNCHYKWKNNSNEFNKELLDSLELLYTWGLALIHSGTLEGVSMYPLNKAGVVIKRVIGEE